MMSTTLDSLLQRVTAAVAGHTAKRRPTWAPTLVLDGELVTLMRELAWLEPDEKDVARLWAILSDPKWGPVRCLGFELRAGLDRSGKEAFRAQLNRDGSWWTGPRWVAPKPRWVAPSDERVRAEHERYERRAARYPKLCRMTELAAARVADFAGHPDEQMKQGAILACRCMICGRVLTDPLSLDRGIGPECAGSATQ